MRIYTAIATALAALWTGVSGDPLLACDNDGVSNFVADDRSLCVFYQCVSRTAAKFACAKGSRVPSYFTKSPSAPCIVKLKKDALVACDRYNVADDPIPDAKNANQCAQFRPCDARRGCTCVDQVAGYYCSCPSNPVVVPTPARAPVEQCDVNVCRNGGTCYSLYKNKFCSCKPPYTGKFCEADACDSMVCNNGICAFDRFGVYCQCAPCYTGQQCQDKIENCLASCDECMGGANCTVPRVHLCKCNPCPSDSDACTNSLPGRGPRRCVSLPKQ